MNQKIGTLWSSFACFDTYLIGTVMKIDKRLPLGIVLKSELDHTVYLD